MKDKLTGADEKADRAKSGDPIPEIEDFAESSGARSIVITVEGRDLNISEVMRIMGAIGGSRKNPRKGFASASPEKRREAALKGLAKRWGETLTQE